MNTELENWRKKIDALDKELVNVLSKRVAIVKKIGKIKKENNLPPFDKKRWKDVVQNIITLAEKLGLSKKFIESIYTIIHIHSLEIEKESL